MKKINKNGFTLIEMLVVIAIIAILAAIIIPTATNSTEKARQARDVANIRSLVAQFEISQLNDGAADTTNPAYTDLVNFEKSSKVATYNPPSKDTDANTYTLSYVSTLLKDGNKKDAPGTYEWTLGALLTEPVTTSGSGSGSTGN